MKITTLAITTSVITQLTLWVILPVITQAAPPRRPAGKPQPAKTVPKQIITQPTNTIIDPQIHIPTPAVDHSKYYAVAEVNHQNYYAPKVMIPAVVPHILQNQIIVPWQPMMTRHPHSHRKLQVGQITALTADPTVYEIVQIAHRPTGKVYSEQSTVLLGKEGLELGDEIIYDENTQEIITTIKEKSTVQSLR